MKGRNYGVIKWNEKNDIGSILSCFQTWDEAYETIVTEATKILLFTEACKSEEEAREINRKESESDSYVIAIKEDVPVNESFIRIRVDKCFVKLQVTQFESPETEQAVFETVQRRYRLEDAKAKLREHFEDYSDEDIEATLDMPFDYAAVTLAERYDRSEDANIAENDLWEELINDLHRERKAFLKSLRDSCR